MSAGILEYIIRVTEDNFGSTIKHARSEVEQLDTSVKKVHEHMRENTGAMKGGGGEGGFMGMGSMGKLLEIGLIIEAGRKMIEFGNDSVEAFNKSEQAAAQLRASLESTGYAANRSEAQLNELAENMKNKTLFDDDDIVKSESVLLTFKNIKEEIFDQTIPAIADLSQKMAGDGPADLKGATVQVGKALDNPIQGVVALRRVGVSFSQSQMQMIKSLQESGKVMEAQKIILKELNSEFGGSAEAAAKVGTGPFKVLGHQWEDIKEKIGGALMEVGSKAIPYIKKLIDLFNDMGKHFKPVKEAIAGLWDALKPIRDAYSGLAKDFGLVNDKMSLGEGLMKGLTKVLRGLKPIVAGIAEVIGTAVKEIGHIVRVIREWYERTIIAQKVMGALVAVASSVFTSIKDAAVNAFKSVGDIIEGVFNLDWKKIKQGLREGLESIKEGNPITMSVRAAKAAMDGWNKGDPFKGINATTEEETTKEQKTGGKPKKKKDENAMQDVTVSAGRSVRNVVVNIHNLVNSLEVKATTVKEGLSNIKGQVEEALIGIVMDSEIALG